MRSPPPPPPPPSNRKARKGPPPPPHLEAPERKLWMAITRENHFESEAALALLRSTLEAHQRARTCRETVDREGPIYRDRFNQPKPHPLIAAERDARAAFVAGMRSLNLDMVGETK
jgi:hypothetical protein